MQKIKTVIPKSHEHAHCLKICYWELNPYHFVRRMNRLPFKSRSNAWIWASELWKDAVGERLRAHCSEKNTHANTHIDMNFIWNHFVDPKGTRQVNLGQREMPHQTREGDREWFRKCYNCWSSFSLTNWLWLSTHDVGEWGEIIKWVW